MTTEDTKKVFSSSLPKALWRSVIYTILLWLIIVLHDGNFKVSEFIVLIEYFFFVTIIETAEVTRFYFQERERLLNGGQLNGGVS